MIYNDEQRRQISEMSIGKIIESFVWEADGKYWVITLTDGSEISIRIMAECV